MTVLRSIGCLLATLVAVGCGSGGSGADSTEEAGSFLAFAGDFQGFRDWSSFDVTGESALTEVHQGQVIIYVSDLPPPGLTQFPTGTRIVKEAILEGQPTQIFAMAKRGGNFNSGAPGWEWFELEDVAEKNGVKINWRGFGPPAGEKYAGDLESECNTCHRACGNDSVCTTHLDLSSF
ncbi:MAG TPA: hypothetical protein VFQ61_33545 [Polyangiaceae bacterium]|nr:hypothetical protein [Polyangiaceae bacterium]